MESNVTAPHGTVFWIKAITYEILPTGEYSGTPVQELEQILEIKGQDKLIALRKTNEFLEEMKQCSRQK